MPTGARPLATPSGPATPAARPFAPSYPPLTPPPAAKTSLWSGPPGENPKVRPALVLSIIGLCCVGLTSVAGLILGILALKEIDESGGAQTGRGMAIAAIVIGAVMSALGLLSLVA